LLFENVATSEPCVYSWDELEEDSGRRFWKKISTFAASSLTKIKPFTVHTLKIILQSSNP
jgi:hypothetical protein